jgi:hypothetical protein
VVIRYNGIELDRKNRTVTHLDETYVFQRHPRSVRFELFCHLVLGGGLSMHMLFDLFYQDDPEGGPIEGPHYFLIVLNHMEKSFFDRLQVEWRAWRIAGVNFYCIVPKQQLRDPKHRSLYKNLRRRVPAEVARGS